MNDIILWLSHHMQGTSMTDIILQYYQGIVQNLRSEVDEINNLLHHQGVKGEGNETALRDLLTKFIPKRFGVGTGVVIDRQGAQSRQCDIIIYDTLLYPSLLSLTNVHLFPVDIVSAIIEVKTTLTSSSALEAQQNIVSVKQLDFIKDQFAGTAVDGGDFSINAYTPTPPLGFIFAYNSNAQQFETFQKWFSPTNADEASLLPSVVGCLDQGLILLMKNDQLQVYPDIETQAKGWMIPLMNLRGQFYTFVNDQKTFFYNNHVYPVKKIDDTFAAIDQSRILLLFLLILQDMLSVKNINPGISFLNTYFNGQPISAHIELR